MIPLRAIVDEIEQLVQRAKQTDSEEETKASLTAIQSLCHVALQHRPSASSHTVRRTEAPMPQQPIQSPQPVYERPVQSMNVPLSMEEPVSIEGANGDSLFDF